MLTASGDFVYRFSCVEVTTLYVSRSLYSSEPNDFYMNYNVLKIGKTAAKVINMLDNKAHT